MTGPEARPPRPRAENAKGYYTFRPCLASSATRRADPLIPIAEGGNDLRSLRGRDAPPPAAAMELHRVPRAEPAPGRLRRPEPAPARRDRLHGGPARRLADAEPVPIDLF